MGAGQPMNKSRISARLFFKIPPDSPFSNGGNGGISGDASFKVNYREL